MNVWVSSISLFAIASAANGGYVGSVVGMLGDERVSSLTINAGESFSGAVVLEGVETRSDFALFRIVSSTANLEYSAGWYEWSTPFTTGGIDDFSSPASTSNGSIDEDTYLDPFAPGEIDVVFENLTDTFGKYFGTGVILSFTLKVPDAFAEGAFTLDFVPDTFTAGASFVDAATGQALTVNVVPSPMTITFVAFGGLLWCSRKR